MMENINDVVKKLGYIDAENLERCVESYGEPLGEWWEVIKSLVKKSNGIHNVIECVWTKSFDGHYNISCVKETRERGNSNFDGKWKFKYCPYCGGKLSFR